MCDIQEQGSSDEKKEPIDNDDKNSFRLIWALVITGILLAQFSYSALTVAPEALQKHIMQEFDITNAQYSSMVSIAQWSSLFDILHGYVIERLWGLKKATYVYLSLAVFGNIIFVVSTFLKSYPLMITGRFIFGMGSSPLSLCMGAYSIHWFHNTRIFNVMLALSSSITYIGLTVTVLVAIPLFNFLNTFKSVQHQSLAATLCTLSIVYMTITIASSLTLASLLGKKKTASAVTDVEDETKNDEKDAEKGKKSKYSLNFTFKFWVLSTAVFVYMMSTYSFMTMSQGFYYHTYHVNVTAANHLSSIFTLVQLFMAPIVGIINDRLGRNHVCFSLAIGTAILAHGLFRFSHINPIISTFFLGFSGGLSNSVWVLFVYTSRKDEHIIAYGIAQTGACGSTAVASFLSGFIVDHFGYMGLELFYLILATCAVPIDLLLWFLDFQKDSVLNLTMKQHQERNEKEEKPNLDESFSNNTISISTVESQCE